LQDKLREALESEEFERAAKLRDDIKRLSQNN
jgi:protein-arginine kinase activator protein McsA